jgi:bifunctional non-homologous end joining protein LigD
MQGKRMHGRWALIRMRDDKAKPGRKVRHNWLLIKEKDEFALPGEPDALLAADTSVKTGRTLEEIASSKTSKVWQSSRKKDGGSNDDEPPVSPVTVKKKNPPSRVAKARKRTPQKK